MTRKASSVEEYIACLPEEQKSHFERLRKAVLKTIDKEFKEAINYGMVGYVIPHEKYSEGYHCDPKLPLPFANIAAQKSSINLYHMGIYADKELSDWFQAEYSKVCKYKLDMGKSCIRFKKYDDIPYDLVSQLFSKMKANDWIKLYEMSIKK